MNVSDLLGVDQVDWDAPWGSVLLHFKVDPATYLMCGLEEVT